MLQCLLNSIMCAMCFYELIKMTFEAKQGEMMERGKEDAGGDGRNEKDMKTRKR